ncbi:MAG: nitrilase family protein [Bacteroidetes bacterium]|nr:nitrilase family protein [Bacteroidota bacterium]
MKSLKIAGLNLDIIWKNKIENYLSIEKKAENILADIIVLPEMFSTGFCMDANEIADQKNETLQWMINLATTKQTAIAGSVAVRENGKFFNRFYFVFPDGSYDFYDKRHLFSYSGEDKVYTPGKERKIINYKGFRILLQICYDLRFPVFSRNNDDYDAVFFVANWPESRVVAWNHLLKARAIENQAFVFGVNRIGTDGNNLTYTKSSHCFSFDGEEISVIEDEVFYATLDKDQLLSFREKFQFLNDRDAFSLL